MLYFEYILKQIKVSRIIYKNYLPNNLIIIRNENLT
jgi:hypothetical protein